MKVLIFLFTVTFSLSAFAQNDSTLAFGPRLLAIDANPDVAEIFNAEIAQLCAGYSLAFVERDKPGRVRHVLKSDDNATVRLDYKCAFEERDGKKISTVSYQRISGDAPVIANIYNSLFSSDIKPDDLPILASGKMEIVYKENIYQLVVEADDYFPGYWMLTFLR